ncbi:MAG: fumarate hydratase C-terminal domain-containing protein [Sedimentisphaerales bacterium]|nr:fumarate hydratase C-terminal domain-containing protein [Sedimentisphaerales bacterium]
MIHLTTPITEADILRLHVGDAVQISGIATTARDAAHKYMVEKLIEAPKPLAAEDKKLYDELYSILHNGAVYHCGPIVQEKENQWRFVSSGPTTSIREEIYQDKVIAEFGVRVVIGKGGMGARTLAACEKYKAVYLHGIGGAGVYNASSIVEVLDNFKKDEFGSPEAFWKIRFDHFTGIVTMDAYGKSLHESLAKQIDGKFDSLIGISKGDGGR